MKTEKKWRITANAEKVYGEDEREKTMSRKGKRFIFFTLLFFFSFETDKRDERWEVRAAETENKSELEQR